MILDLQRSNHVAEHINLKPGYAFENALCALDHLPQHAHYVEGWRVHTDSGALENRGWCEVDGCVIDPLGHDTNVRYFPGVRYPRKRAKALAAYARRPPLTWHNTDVTDHEWYLQALENAQQEAQRCRQR